jgi:hypothetical protein
MQELHDLRKAVAESCHSFVMLPLAPVIEDASASTLHQQIVN